MFLYELAIELDRRSGELIDLAAELGMGVVTASSTLDAAQVHQLRARLGPSGGASGTPELPPPATFAPPPEEAPEAPEPPPSLTIPPVPPAHALVPPVTFEPPVHFEAVAFAPDEADAPAAPPAGAGPGGSSLPPPPPPPPPSSAAVGAGSASSPLAGFSRSQRIVLASVVVAVVALFGFMVATSGPDRAREREIAEADRRAEASQPTTTLAPATTTTVKPSVDQAKPVDVTTFCEGGVPLLTLQARFLVAAADDDFGELQDLSRERRAEWEANLDKVAVGGPPMYVDEVQRYERGVGAWMDALLTTGSALEAYQAAGGIEVDRALNAGDDVLRQVPFYCS
ncbi:MAG: translation initiation factor IF-2 N-terminal domain-containing protein [Acidimicrobiales bacterium]|nr:translation initiation factor IF-2 N-terminal domain-containing protein [Acidimicrobiales bacterium]HRW38874.1 hypothetical protein [Aquihabitans sp.]